MTETGSSIASPPRVPAEVPRPPTDVTRSAVVSGPLRWTLLTLALPVLGEQLLNTLVAVFDVWLAGRISAAATAAVGLAAYVSWLAAMIVMMVGTGTTAVVARLEGSGRPQDANRYMNQSMTLAAILGLGLLAFLYLSAPGFARYTAMAGEAYDITVTYLRVEAVGHTFLSLTLVGCAALRGAGNMRTPMFVFAIINVVNIVASCVYVFVLDLGVNGIVGGTVTARIVGAVLLVGVLIRGSARLKLLASELRIVKEHALRILRVGFPAGADGALMWSGHFAFLAIVSRVYPGSLGEAAFAAHVIAVRVEAMIYLPATAWAYATATMIGQSLGAGDPDRARRAGHEAVLQCGVLAVIVSIVYYIFAEEIFALMTVDSMVQTIGVTPFRVLTILLPLIVVSIVYVGGLRGAGDTRFPMLITMAGVIIRLSLGYYFGIVLGLGLLGAWIGMFGDMVWRAIATTIRYLGGHWLTTRV